jgi:hypothetical protein
MSADFEYAVYHIKHHTRDINLVGKYALPRLPRKLGYKCVLTDEGSEDHFGRYPIFFPHFLRGKTAAMGASWVDGDADKSTNVLRAMGIVRRSYDANGGDVCYFSSTPLISLSAPAAKLRLTVYLRYSTRQEVVESKGTAKMALVYTPLTIGLQKRLSREEQALTARAMSMSCCLLCARGQRVNGNLTSSQVCHSYPSLPQSEGLGAQRVAFFRVTNPSTPQASNGGSRRSSRTTCRCHAREPHLQAPQVYLNGLESTDTVSHYSSDFRQQCPHPPQLLARLGVGVPFNLALSQSLELLLHAKIILENHAPVTQTLPPARKQLGDAISSILVRCRHPLGHGSSKSGSGV